MNVLNFILYTVILFACVIRRDLGGAGLAVVILMLIAYTLSLEADNKRLVAALNQARGITRDPAGDIDDAAHSADVELLRAHVTMGKARAEP